MKRKLFPYFSFACILSSAALRSRTVSEAGRSSADSSLLNPKLVFVNFSITKDSLQEHSTVSLKQIKITEGSLKKNNLSDLYETPFRDNLRCVFADVAKRSLTETVIEHPLFKRYEYAMDDGSLGIKSVALKEAVFFIRVAYDPKMKYILIFEKLSSSSETKIAEFEFKI